jgi:hypothetical protein
VVHWFGRVRRYRQITWILARRGLWGYVTGRREDGEDTSTQRRLARSLARSMEEAGVVFVKLGQVLATRRDLLPPVFVEELGRLHSEVAPIPAERIQEVVERGLGRPVGEVQAEKLLALAEYVVLSGVQVLRPLSVAHRSRAEANHLPTPVSQREHDAAAEAVVVAALPALLREAAVFEFFEAKARLLGPHDHPIPGARRVADPKLAEDLLGQAAAREVLARRSRLG